MTATTQIDMHEVRGLIAERTALQGEQIHRARAASHLSGIPARRNAARLADIAEVVATMTTHIDLLLRFAEEDVADLAALEPK